MSIAFSFLCAIMIYVSYRVSHNIINVVSVFAAPYMLIVPLNNIFMVQRGFYLISDQVIYMIGGCLLCIFVGYLFVNGFLFPKIGRSAKDTSRSEDIFTYYNVRAMIKYTFFVETVVLIRFIFIIITNGISYITTGNFEGQMLRGPLGHLLLTIYPIVPILFLYWLKNKRKIQYFLVTVLCVGLLFTTFVKYHVISMVVLIYLFVSIEDKKYARKGLIILVSSAVGLFIFNYLLTFILRGTNSNVAQEFYFNHLWSYISGSLINDSRIFTDGIRVGVSIFYKLGTALFAIPNAFLTAFFDEEICPHNALPFFPVASNGQLNNVVDTFGYYFPSKGSLIDIIIYAVVFILIGIIFSAIYEKSISKTDHFRITICIFMTFFIFFSFFGTFYVLLPPWEILVWSAIMMTIFDKRKIVRIGRKRLF